MASRCFVRPTEVEGYHPANHSGTINRRLMSPDTVGSSRLEVVPDVIEKNQGALPHAHPGIEQVCYLLSGRAVAEVAGERHELVPGDVVFFPPDMPHVFTAISNEPVKLLVICSPPYGEDSAKVVRSTQS